MRIGQILKSSHLKWGSAIVGAAAFAGYCLFSGQQKGSAPQLNTGDPSGSISSIDIKNGKVDKPWVLSFLRNVQDRNLLSSRYTGFITIVRELALKGKISFEFQDSENSPGDLSCVYNVTANSLKISKSKEVKDEAVKAEFESSLVHELYHAYQDYNKAKGPEGTIESEAYLAASDFLSHAYPSQLSDSWVIINPGRDPTAAYTIRFNAPRRMVLSTAEHDSIVEIIARNYASSVVFNTVLFSGSVMRREELFFQAAQQNPTGFDVSQQIQQAIDAFGHSGQTHVQGMKHGDKINFTFSSSLLDFMVAARVHLHSSLRHKGFADAQNHLDQYYNLFRVRAMPPGSNIFNLLNQEVVCDGIQ